MIAFNTTLHTLSPRGLLRIAMIGSQSSWSGGENQAHLLALELRSRGHDVTILGRQSSPFAVRHRSAGFAVHEFLGSGRNPWGAWQVRRCLRRLRPHIIHANDTHALTAVGLALCGCQRPPCVVSRRVDFPIRAAQPFRIWCDRILCVSTAVAQVCRDSGIPGDRLQVVPDGCDPVPLKRGNRQRGRRAMQVDDSMKVLLTVARLADHKGHRYLLDALPAVLAHEPNTRLVLAGDGELRPELERQVHSLGLQHHVQFLGHRTDVADLMHGADRLVIPSHMEGLCSSIIEAMMVKLPVIATAAGGIPDLLGARLSESAVGVLVSPRDPQALASAIVSSLHDDTPAKQLALRAHHRAIREFTSQRMANITLSAYRSLMAASTRVASHQPFHAQRVGG